MGDRCTVRITCGKEAAEFFRNHETLRGKEVEEAIVGAHGTMRLQFDEVNWAGECAPEEAHAAGHEFIYYNGSGDGGSYSPSIAISIGGEYAEMECSFYCYACVELSGDPMEDGSGSAERMFPGLGPARKYLRLRAAFYKKYGSEFVE